MKKFVFIILSICCITSCSPETENPFERDVSNYPILQKVLENKEQYQVQILYTQIDRNEHGTPMFTNYSFNLDDDRYFYPASTVKLPIALLALEWLDENSVDNLDKETIFLIDSVRPSQIPAYVDNSSKDSLPSIAHYIKKILLVSDNDANNRLYELLGQEYINEKLKGKGLWKTVISQRLSFPISPEENRYFNPIRFVDKSGNTLLEIPERHTEKIYAVDPKPLLGKAHVVGDSLINEPMDFSYKNKFALSDLHGVVQRIVFPNAFLESERFHISEENRKFVLKYMSMFPEESDFPKYDSSEFYDGYSKFFKFGNSENPIPKNFRIFNKTGWSYGYMIDGSYFLDLEKGVEFFVSAIVYSNENETLNDNIYEYEEIGKPFFAELGEYLYQRELNRRKLIQPDLSEFKFDY
ncbi:serine hydrolase [Algoriphagus lutimaris]|uniref:serine hydrolase n=1 Tax=Algoriphagus lutimaris TaxID=613197 RepID=UPI00196B4C6C|nr:serine hydrolase [Algoriphagus lutimaris]MBN3521279.1 serine hydrolase [Algoriphagus lutimaris]